MGSEILPNNERRTVLVIVVCLENLKQKKVTQRRIVSIMDANHGMERKSLDSTTHGVLDDISLTSDNNEESKHPSGTEYYVKRDDNQEELQDYTDAKRLGEGKDAVALDSLPRPTFLDPEGYHGGSFDDADDGSECVESRDHVSLRIVDMNELGGSSQLQPRTSSPEAIAALIESLRSSNGDLVNITDFDIKRRVKDFRLAQTERRKRYWYRPYGIVGLFVNLSDTRADLRWAEDAAWRRAEHMPYVCWKDYEEARQRGMKRPYFTYSMVCICTVLMLVAFHLNNWQVEPLRVNPLLGPKPGVLLLLGALQMREIVQTGTWYRLVTSVFLHGGVLHLAINLVVLGLLGRAVERNHGLVETASIFFISAIGGNIISCLMQPGYILVGSSGGIFGLIGICVADIVLNWKILFLVFRNYDGSAAGYVVRCLAIFWLGLDLVLNSAVGFTPFVDNFAHLGGLTYGFFISLTVLQRLPLAFFGKGQGPCFRIRIRMLRVMGAFIALTLFFITGTLLSQSDGIKSPCHKCRYISCIPFPFWSKDKWWYCDGCDAVSGKVFHRNDDDVIFSNLDLFCPEGGETVEIDISGGQYKDTSDVQKILAGYCREYC